MAGINFARRPFRDERQVYLAAGTALAAAVVLLALNVRLYAGYHASVAGTSREIAELNRRKADAAVRTRDARGALEAFRMSSLAAESQGLLKIVAERHFSWTALLARLERVLPAEVRVTRLSPRFDGRNVNIIMTLVGKDSTSVVRTITALARDPAFSVIDLKSEQSPEQGIPEGRTFEVSARYAAPEPTGSRAR